MTILCTPGVKGLKFVESMSTMKDDWHTREPDLGLSVIFFPCVSINEFSNKCPFDFDLWYDVIREGFILAIILQWTTLSWLYNSFDGLFLSFLQYFNVISEQIGFRKQFEYNRSWKLYNKHVHRMSGRIKLWSFFD